MDTLICNVTVVTMNDRMEVLFGANIGIEGGKISYIGKKTPQEHPATIIDGTGMVAIPGLINCHTHLAATALRSCFDELDQAQALEQLLQKEARMDSRCAKAAVTLGLAECLRFGVTSVSDLYYYPDATAQVLADAGMKGNLALSAYRFIDAGEDFDFETDEQCQALCRVVERWHGYDNDRIRIDCGIHSEYTSNYRLWEALAAYAEERQLGMQLHLSETQPEVDGCLERNGLSPVELLQCHGFFRRPTTAAGCACLSEDDLKILGRHHVTAALTPLTSAKSGLPLAAAGACVRAGMNVTLGTGGAMECGNTDLFEVMRGVALTERAKAGRADALPASAALMMATICGARAQGRAQQCGMLCEGMDADIVLVDFSAPHLMPCHNVLSALVFGAKGGDVAMTMVRGRILYRDGQFPTLDLSGAVEELTEYVIPRLFGDKE